MVAGVLGAVVGVLGGVVGVFDVEALGGVLGEVADDEVEVVDVVGALLVDELLGSGSSRTRVSFLLTSWPAAFFTVSV